MRTITAEDLELEILESSDDSLIYPDLRVLGDLSLISSKELNFAGCVFEDINCDYLNSKISFRKCKAKLLSISNAKEGSIVRIFEGGPGKSKFEKILIDDSSCQFDINGGKVGKLEISSAYPSSKLTFVSRSASYDLFILASGLASGSISSHNDSITHLNVSGTYESSIFFQNTKNLAKFRIGYFHMIGNGEFFIDGLKVSENPKSMILEYAELRNVRINNSELSDLNFSVIYSTLKDLGINNTQLPALMPSEDLFQEKENFRQLKLLFQNNQDFIQAKEMAALELEHYWLYQKSSKKSNWFKRLPLLISKKTNNFGRSWPLAFWSLLGWTVSFYLVLGIVQSSNLETFLEFISSGRIFIFLNPVHSLESVLTNECISKYWFGIYAIDFLQRLFSGFYIYQLIRAFRFHYNT